MKKGKHNLKYMLQRGAKTTVHKIQQHLYCLPAFLKYTYLKMTYAGRNMSWFLRNYLQYSTDCPDGWKTPIICQFELHWLAQRVASNEEMPCVFNKN